MSFTAKGRCLTGFARTFYIFDKICPAVHSNLKGENAVKLATFSPRECGERHLGVVDDSSKRILDLSSLGVQGDMLDLIQDGKAGLEGVRKLCSEAPASAWIPLSDIVLQAPLAVPRNIFCVGKNYHAHAQEFHNSGYDAASKSSAAIPALPIVFTKATTAVIGPQEPIPSFLDETNSVDYEGELAVIIGRGGRGIERADALDHVFGFTILNDVTSRKLQRDHAQWFIGKSLDGFCPMGPWIVSTDELGPLEEIGLRTFVDGELRQSARLVDMIFDVPELIATISRRTTLMPGDVIATGTPEGVGIGFTPPKFLQRGQRVRVEIDRIGVLENAVE
jgi:2-keto-4-pentenoate hydratase/2-oxohepta-3-ene-1,7-dioic acid hydratase in catechol pathway